MRDYTIVRVRFVLLAALVWLLPTFAAAQAVTVQLTATEVFDPLGFLTGDSVGAFTSEGTVTCPGAQPTGDPMRPCPPGSRMKYRGVSWMSRLEGWTLTGSPSPLLTGWFYGDSNGNFDANGTGQVWGTFRIELDAGGVWEGSWTADRSKAETVWVLRVRVVGGGKGGAVDGMQLRFKEDALQFQPSPLGWVGSIDAEILAPPSKGGQ